MVGLCVGFLLLVLVVRLLTKGSAGLSLQALFDDIRQGAADGQKLIQQSQPKRYRSRGSPLTRAEVAFYAVLAHAVYPQLIVFPKIRVTDLIEITADRRTAEGSKAWNQVAQKHVDFVLCEPATLNTVAVLELDDRSHDRPDRQRRDALVDQAFTDADIRILHIQCQSSYSQPDTRRMIFAELGISA